MLGLTLRQEFRGRRIKGTVVDFNNRAKTGALDQRSEDFLKITYPSLDILKALENCTPGNSHPLVLQGARGQGKSHLMAVIYHAFKDRDATEKWLGHWADKLNKPKIKQFSPPPGFQIIAESLHKQRYKFIWDLIFDRHPKGEFYKGKWDNKTPVPSYDVLIEMFKEYPTVLLLDEFQTWFEGLTNSKQYPYQTWAFNFIQILSEIANEVPDSLILVVSVRNGTSDAYQQLHRVAPIIVNFTETSTEETEGVEAGTIAIKKLDRQKMILHRLFENRDQVGPDDIRKSLEIHIAEFFKLKNIIESEHEKWKREFIDCWPFSPILLRLLEDQVLVSTDAQETRDLIRILASLYRAYEEKIRIITPACFRIDSGKSGVTTLIDSISGEYHEKLLGKAQRNLEAVQNAFSNEKSKINFAAEIISSLWIRSLVVENRRAGAENTDLQLDITQEKLIDENTFQIQLNDIVGNSFNIHEIEDRYIFKQEENADAKLRAYARNDKWFLDGADIEQLSDELRYVLEGEGSAAAYRITVLRRNWRNSPWEERPESFHPNNQKDGRIPIVVVPEANGYMSGALGKWLKEHWPLYRNSVRFLLPKRDQKNIFYDKDLIFLSRLIVKALQWKSDNHDFAKLLAKYRLELRSKLRILFDRVAILEKWDFSNPDNCEFSITAHGSDGDKIVNAIEEIVQRDLFIPEEFVALVDSLASKGESVSKLIGELREPRPNKEDCIPWIGEERVKEELLKLCAGGKLAINVRGLEFLQSQPGETYDETWHRVKGKLGRGRELESTTLLQPQSGLSTSSSIDIKSTSDDKPRDISDGSQISDDGSIFDQPKGSEEFREHSTESPTSALNLLGKTESWGVGLATPLRNVRVTVNSMNGSQLERLLKNLPDGTVYDLCLEKEK